MAIVCEPGSGRQTISGFGIFDKAADILADLMASSA